MEGTEIRPPFTLYSVPALLFALAVIYNTVSAQNQDMRVLQSDTRGILLEYLPAFNEASKVKSEGSEFVSYDFRGSVPLPEIRPGSPLLQVRSILLRLPGERGNRVEILSADYKDISNILLLPVPSLIKGEIDPLRKYSMNAAAYAKNELMPVTLASLEAVGETRGAFFGELWLYPCQYNPATRLLRQYSRILVRVNFGEAQNPVKPARSAAKGLAINDDAFPARLLQLSKGALRSSVLSSGPWFKFAVTEDGMYKLTGQMLMDAGIPISADPATIKIYGNGGTETPMSLAAPYADDLIQNAIYVLSHNGSAPRLDPYDYIIFYGRGTRGWNYSSADKTFRHYINHYCETNYYWLTYGGAPGKRMNPAQSPNNPSPFKPSNVMGKLFREDEKVNVISSGIEWLGQPFNPGDAMTYVHPLPSLDPSQPIFYRFRVGAQSSSSSQFNISEHNSALITAYIPASYGGDDPQYLDAELSARKVPDFQDAMSQLRFSYNTANQSGSGYIDWYEVFYTRLLGAQKDVFSFHAYDTTAVARYDITGFEGGDVLVFDVSKFDSVVLISSPRVAADTCSFQLSLSAGSPREIYAVGQGGFKTPGRLSSVLNQNLHGDPAEADYVIVTHADFMQAALRLKAQRELPSSDYLKTIIVDVDQIYNEFGGGLYTPVAIRNYLRYIYSNWSSPPGYLLLFGDGDYDYKRIMGESTPNWIPPWETAESFDPLRSYTSDDAFGIFKANSDRVNLGIGRLPARSAADADNMVDKIIDYEKSPVADPWKLRFTFVADDGPAAPGENNGFIHTQQADDISGIVPPLFEKLKIYEYEYPTVYAAGGRRKPAVNLAIQNQINQGTLLLNFTGHGNPHLWAHEAVFVNATDFPLLHNKGKYFFLVAATCNYANFDMVNDQSGGELLVLEQDAGAISVFSATRPSFAYDNFLLNETLYRNIFVPDSIGRLIPQRLGDVVYRTKQIRTTDNDRKYFLLGDPAIKLAFPRLYASVDSINHLPGTQVTQLKALQKTSLSATVRDTLTGQRAQFSGRAQVVVFDANRKVVLTDPDLKSAFSYTASGSVLFRGEAGVADGRISASFIVPRDISYSNDFGRLTLYFWNGAADGAGYTTNFRVSGTDSLASPDASGPRISLYIDNRGFRPGDIVSGSPVLLADLMDSSGINTSGAGIGHRLEAWLDAVAQSIDLGDYYKSKTDTYQEGTIEFPMGALSEGTHRLKLRAWDTYNNPSSDETVFNVTTGEGLKLTNVFNYPNPLASSTVFTFEHNQVSSIDAQVKIYTVAGRLIQSLKQENMTGRFIRIPWDGYDKDGDRLANGVYLYKIMANTHDGRFTSEAFGKLSIIK